MTALMRLFRREASNPARLCARSAAGSLPATGAPAAAGPTGTRGAVAVPSLPVPSTGAPAAGGTRFFGPASPISRTRLGAWTPRLALVTGVPLVSARPLIAVAAVRGYYSSASKRDDFSSLWSMEKKIGVCTDMVVQAHGDLIAHKKEVKALREELTRVHAMVSNILRCVSVV